MLSESELERISNIEEKINALSLEISNSKSVNRIDACVKKSLYEIINSYSKDKAASAENYLHGILVPCTKWKIKNLFSNTDKSDLLIKNHIFYSHDNGYKFQINVTFFPEIKVFINIMKGENDDLLVWPIKYLKMLVSFYSCEEKLKYKLAINTQEEMFSSNLLYPLLNKPKSFKNPPFFKSKINCSFEDLVESLKNGILDLIIEIDSNCIPTNCPDDTIINSPSRCTVLYPDIDIIQESLITLVIRYNFSTSIKCTELKPFSFCYHQHLSPSANYFEVEILSLCSETSSVGVGLSPRSQFGQEQMPGLRKNSWAFHTLTGQVFSGAKDSGVAYGPKCAVGDIIGCGVNFEVKQIDFHHKKFNSKSDFKSQMSCAMFITVNGILASSDPVDMAWSGLTDANSNIFQVLYPTVGLSGAGTSVRYFTPISRSYKDFVIQ